MIKKINYIRKFGIYDNFNWSTLPEFAPKNLIYGWNYSGKTTLSRLFVCLEEGKLNLDYSQGEFEFILDSSVSITNQNLPSNINLPKVKVFNEDFIRKNLKWDGEGFNPILLLGKLNIETTLQMEANQNKIQAYKSKQNKFSSNATETEIEYENELTETASNIKELLRLSTYTKAHIKQSIQEVLTNLDDSILRKEEIEILRIKAASEDKLDQINRIDLKIEFKSIIERLITVLNKVPSVLKTITDLENNSKLSSWVEQGLELHNHDDNCKFCNSPLKIERITEIEQHFSKDYKKLVAEITELHEEIEALKVHFELPDESRFYKELREKYSQLRITAIEGKDRLNQSISTILQALMEKARNVFNTYTVNSGSIDDVQLRNTLEDINEIISSHNKRSNDFEHDKNLAISKLKKHYLARHLSEKNYKYKLDKVTRLRALSYEYKEMINSLISINQNLEAKVSSIHKGGENLNLYIQGFLGRKDLQIEVDQSRFVLKRNGKDASNLSEGEKTAIAFSYYLTNLESGNLSESIIFIDDPISSLDSNHIYHVYSLISNVLFDDRDLKCRQLFISTHNFEFYSLLKESEQLKAKAKNTGKYLTKRDSLNRSMIKELPKQLIDFRSEYQYLFKIIKDFYHDENKEDYSLLFVLPNIIRKFLESYTSTRLPNSSGLEDRVKQLFKDDIASKALLKFIHSHNHFNGVMQQSKHDDTINLCEPTVTYILEWLEKNDPIHYQSLSASYN